MALTRAAVIAALLACLATGALAESCTQDLFCARWMCEQNAQRRDALAGALNVTLLPQAILDDCNAQQGGSNLLSTTCTVNGVSYDIGMRYDKTTCNQERPPQLEVINPKTGVNSMSVQSKSVALSETNLTKTAEALNFFRNSTSKCGQTDFVPLHPCICEPGIAEDYCVARIRFDVFFNKTSGVFNQSMADKFAGEFVLRNSLNNANLNITDVNGARPNALENCKEHFGMAACDAISPGGRRRRLQRRRALIEHSA